ncbi:MAG: MarR family EPS-associated transcriptional regulator, partial [Pseudomonadota bacterium]
MITARKTTPEDDDQLFRLLRQLDQAPEASQRTTAAALGMSLGRLNTLLRRAQDQGFVRVTDRVSADRRQRFAYALTPRGGAEKNRLTTDFLARKLAEYDALHAELTGTNPGLSQLKNRTTLMDNNLAPIPELFVSYDSAQK